jgi:adenylate cyclase
MQGLSVSFSITFTLADRKMQFSNKNNDTNEQHVQRVRFPLFLRIGLIVVVIAVFFAGAGATFFWKHHRNVLFDEKIQAADSILNYAASLVEVSLLVDDTLRLNSVVHYIVDVPGVVYAVVLDRSQVVQAYAGKGDFGAKTSGLADGEILSKKNGTVTVHYTDEQAGQVYDLSRMVMYNEKPLGTVHLGLSRQFINESLDGAKSSFLQILLGIGGGLLLVLLFITSLYTLLVKRRTGRLLQAAEEYAQGNLQYRIEKIGNNESGDVARALHSMAQRLLVQEPSPAKLEQYLKYSSLDRILENPVSQGEAHAFRRQVAVLFASIKGFGSFAGTENPENIVKALNKYISIVTKVISTHGGYVDKVIGDAVVGIFGVSLYRENHTARALRAAVDLQAALSAGNKNESQLLSNVSVGISSGIVLSGNIGSYAKVEYSSIGESIKEAYWLSNLGQPGEIILGKEIHSQMQDSVQVELLPPQNVLGMTDAMQCYRLLSLTDKKK